MLKVRVPATSANLGPGIDTLGLALNLFMEVEISIAESHEGDCCAGICLDDKDNLIIKALRQVYTAAGLAVPAVNIKVHSQIPTGKGLGSSAAAIVAGLMAGNRLAGNLFSEDEIIKMAADMEGHADNVVPAMVGGMTTSIFLEDKVLYHKINLPEDINIIVVVPDFELPTAQTRSLMPDSIKLKDAVANLQRACFIVAGMFKNDLSSLDIAMQDMIYQPVRQEFIPGFDKIMKAARDNGALGIALSGAGPSVIAITRGYRKKIGLAVQEVLKNNYIASQAFYLQVSNQGATIENTY